MTTTLLTTKLHIPAPRPDLVPRPRLIQRLDDALLGQSTGFARKLTLISAPAGFGKTTLLSEWAAQSKVPIAWLSLDEGDNDPARFWAHFVAALRDVRVDVGDVIQGPYQSPQAPGTAPSLTALLNQLAGSPDPFALVLDDYHNVHVRPIHESLTFLVDHLPPQMHLVIATRFDPPLPMARLRGRGQLTEVYQADLRFTSQEIAELLDLILGPRLSPEDVAALERRTEGWIAGLQMAAISMRGRSDLAGFVRAFTGSHRYILDYLSEEVLRQQTADVQRFLLETAILDRLSAGLCDAVIGGRGREGDRLSVDSQPMLEHLERNNLFVVPLDDERRWYRYHHLFADLLRQRLQREQPDVVPELHARASEWYEGEGLIAEAVGHALTAGDYERAMRLIEGLAWPMVARCETVALLDWLDALPDELIRSRPQLGVARAWALAVTGESDAFASSLGQVDAQQVPGEMAAVRAYAASVRGDAREAIPFAEQALEHLPPDNPFLRGFLALNLGIAYASSGRLAPASRALRQAIELSHDADQIDLTLAAKATLGHVQDSQALLHQALETHREVLNLARDLVTGPAPIVGMATLGIAEVLYEWNDLDGALRHVIEGIKLLELGRFMTYLLFGHSLHAQVCYAQGDLDGAHTAVQQAQRLAQGHDLVYMTAVLGWLQARLDAAQGDLAAAARWAREHRWRADDDLDHAREAEQMGVAWVLIVQASSAGSDGGDEIREAVSLLARLLEAAEEAGRIQNIIKILALQALALQASDDLDGALSALERALSLAEPGGYMRTFVDEGEPMARLLRRALSLGVAPNYAARLLAAFREEVESTSPMLASLVEPLTEREIEVLRLVAAGLSNPEISEELYIALSTVKSHINHIYGKLAVENRVQAINRAHSLELL